MYKIKELSNGMKVLIENLDNMNSISIGVYIKTGSKNECEGEFGVSHLLEHMMFKGTKSRSAKEISEAIDDIGGQMNAYTSKEVTSYYTVLLAEHANIGIEILADMLINSTFTEENLNKEKQVVIEEINMYEDIPEDLIHDLNSQYVIDGSQGRSILGTIDSVKKIDREVLLNYYKRRYKISNAVISIAGKIKNEDDIINLLESHFNNFSKGEKEEKIKHDFTLRQENNIINKKTNQVHMCFNTLGTSYIGDERYLLAILSNVLGGNMSSRLFQKIREEKGLCYSVYSYASSYEEGGMFTIYAGTTKENYLEVLDYIKDEFKEIRENCISELELHKAKNQLLSSMILGLESTKSRMSRLASNYLSLGEIIPIEQIIDKVNNIKLIDLAEFAEKIFHEKNYSMTIIGDLKDEGNTN